jgi:hypothetical protein
VFGIRELGRILGTKEDEIIAGWRKLNNVELHNLYSSPNIIKIIKLGHLECKGAECVQGFGRKT